MRITIDASSTLVRSAGVKTYTYHWIAHLRRQAAPGEEIAAYPFFTTSGNSITSGGRFPCLPPLYGSRWCTP